MKLFAALLALAVAVGLAIAAGIVWREQEDWLPNFPGDWDGNW